MENYIGHYMGYDSYFANLTMNPETNSNGKNFVKFYEAIYVYVINYQMKTKIIRDAIKRYSQ